ncbi:SRPBCC family protein [Nocardia sp. NPDC050175]|uniref:SRPBCC family protein n=1 Tax=Nocardia sp. NPDC050175 TaxID=3364317 RepID=UPI00378BD4CA
MTPRFTLDPVDETFFRTAPLTWRFVVDLAAGPDDVWAGLTARRPLSWCRMLTDVQFAGTGPYDETSTRIAEVGKIVTLHEQFFRWSDTDRRHSFYVTESNLPVFRSFAEDYQVVPTSTGSRLIWTFAIVPRRGFGPALRLNRVLFASLAADTRRHFGKPPITA